MPRGPAALGQSRVSSALPSVTAASRTQWARLRGGTGRLPVGQPRPADPASPPRSLLPWRAAPRRRHVQLVRTLGARSQRPALGWQRLLQPAEPALQRGRPEGLRGQRVSLWEGQTRSRSQRAPTTTWGLEWGPWGGVDPGRGRRPESKSGCWGPAWSRRLLPAHEAEELDSACPETPPNPQSA